jgi:DNA-binding transcriptional LysR family regulator
MELINVDVDLLRALLVVAETKNFTTAGERLFRTQSAISLQIRKLEGIAGQPLLDRGKQIRLTTAGETVLSYAVRILKLNDELVRDVMPAVESVAIRIGTPDDYAQLILPNIIRDFARTNRHIEFQIVSDLSIKLAKMIDANELDIVFITKRGDISGLEHFTEPLTWVGAHGSQAALQEPLSLALSPPGCQIREVALQALGACGRRWKVSYSSNQFSTMRAAIAAGEAISVLPSRAVPRDLVRIGSEFGLPDLPGVELVIKVGPQANPTVLRLAASMSAAMRSRTASLAEAL